MPRPMGSYLEPSAKRATGRQEVTGVRPARDALARGDDFKPGSLAARKELDVYKELESSGVDPLVERNAVRVQTVCDLTWVALVAAAQAGEHGIVEDMCRRFVGFAVRASKLWESVAAVRATTVDGILGDAIEAARGDPDGCD